MLSTRVLRLCRWIICVVIGALAVAGVALAVLEPEPAADSELTGAGGIALAIFEAVVFLAFGSIGAAVVSRQPRNPIGWLLQLIALAFAVLTVTNHVYFHALLGEGEVRGPAAYATWVSGWIWILAIVPAFTIFPLLFPTGRPLSPRWRPLVWTAVIAGLVTFAGTAFVPGPIDNFPAAINPLGIDSPAVEVIGWIAFGVLVPTALASIVSLFVRFRRSHGVERQQLKWAAAAAALLPFAFSGLGTGDGGLSYVILLCGLLIVAAAVAVAMLRYRLYDIDIVISRTLVYGALTATLAAAYLLSVLVLQTVLNPLTENSDLAVAGSTLAVAALFRPIRTRIRSAVDSRFFRRRYDAARTLEAFTQRRREQLDLAALSADLVGVVRETVQPTQVSLWLRP